MGKFIGQVGLQYLWGKIKAVFAKKEDVVVINATIGTSGTAAVTSSPYCAAIWRVDLSDRVDELYSGLTILFKIPVAGNGSYGTLLRIDGTTAADDAASNLYPVCANVTTMISTRYAVGCIIALTFDAEQAGQTLYYESASATTTSANGTGWAKKGCWKIADYDVNTTTTYGTLDYYFRPYTAARLTPYKIVALDKDNRVIPITTEQYCGSYGSSTTYAVDDIVVYENNYYKCIASGKNKTPSTSTSYWQTYTMPTQFTPTTTPFRPEKLRFYNTTTLLAADAATGGQTLIEIGYSTAPCTYTFWTTIAKYNVIYLQGTYDKTTGLFTLDSGANYYKLVPCNTANITLSSYFTSGKYYILLGATYSSNNYFLLFMVNTLYYFDGTNLIPYEVKLANDVVASIPTVPTNVSAFNNDAGYLTSHQDISGKVDREELYEDEEIVATSLVDLNSRLDTVLLDLEDNEQAIAGALTDLNNKVEDIQSINDDLSDVAFSGNYEDLEGTPNIPSWALNNNKPSYTLDEVTDGSTRKLSTYAPLASPALTGTPTAPTAVAGTNTTQVATTAFVKNAIDNTKVIVVNAATLPSTLDPNKVYNLGTLTGTVTIPAFSSVDANDNEVKVWCVTFSTSTTAPTITWPAGITAWNGGTAPTINASKSYEVSVMNGIGVVIET